ncbi:MAG: class I SAM-dependent methyltransferase [Anaerovoracaceae bacterium]
MRSTLTLAEAEDLVEQYALDVTADERLPDRQVYFRDNYRAWEQAYLPVVCEYVEDRLPGRALDCGPGWGTMSVWLAAHGWNVTAMDMMPLGTFMTERQCRECGISYIRAQIEDAPLPGAQFDLALLTQVLGHLKWNPLRTLRNLRSMLAPGGEAIVSALNTPEERWPEFSYSHWRDVPTRDSGADPDPAMNVCAYTTQSLRELLGEVFSPAATHLLQEGGVTVALCRV